jgi:hypothetical protein
VLGEAERIAIAVGVANSIERRHVDARDLADTAAINAMF